jgi:meso-butanediol dehydrogenase / (S,S)-butanediol dehydrogenase / diacetyl reductase
MSKLADKVALVTGAASGMGKETAILFASEGASVVCADVDERGLTATVETIAKAGGKAFAIPFDARDASSCEALVDEAVACCNGLDVLVNVAGIFGSYRLDELTPEIINRFFQINTLSLYTLCQRAMPHLLESKGNIVNFSSVNARVMVGCGSLYSATKAAVMAMTKSLAQEFAGGGVRCNVICPGAIETPMINSARWPEDMDMKMLKKLAPLTRRGTASEVARVALFLASDDAAYISGEDIIVDGGMRAEI